CPADFRAAVERHLKTQVPAELKYCQRGRQAHRDEDPYRPHLPAAPGGAAQAGKLRFFTEHRDTLNSLARRLEEKGYTVATIHGGMDVDSRKQAQRQFRTRAKIMVATDAAGEGINLQFCRHLINWDIPWNPNRLEQRMGRIHRYGQADDVWVYNLVAQNTREGSVLQKVLSKLDVMREQMRSDRVYDVIDEWLEDVPLVRLIESAIDSDDESASARETDAALSTASNERTGRLMDLRKSTLPFANRWAVS
ncbi:MAG: helicase-related protein, partial [Halothiobacillaceae bacterium]